MKKKEKIPLPGVRKIILVVSGKGGVGKSTIAANIAVTLQQQVLNIGLLDADISGPSTPRIFNIKEKPKVVNNQFIPFERQGLKLMSMGFLIPEESAVIWRGPITTKALHQLFKMTKWAPLKTELDYLIVDTPPGTGDVHLSIFENYRIDAAIAVSTPQELAVVDAFKAIDMLKKLNIKIVGMIENMSYLIDKEGEKKHIFGTSQLTDKCQKHQITYLGAFPILSKVAANYFFPRENNFCHKILQQIISKF